MVVWDEQADLIVVGYGGAGAAAALTAAEHGADVLVIEKQPQARHTPSTKMGGGALMAVTDVEKATRYLDRCAAGMVPKAVSRAWAEKAIGVLDWLERHADMRMEKSVGAEHPEFDGADAVQSYAPGGYGQRLFANLSAAVAQRKRIRVRYDAPGRRLVRDADARVIGVEVGGANAHRYGARGGVVLTTGGYEYDEEMKLNYLKGSPIYFYGNPGNTGDGVRMAQDAGAALWHMNQMIGRGIAHFELPDGSGLNCLVLIGGPPNDQSRPVGYVLTDRLGRRFANEHMQAMSRHDFYYLLLAYDPTTNDYPRNPCYWFFDERRMRIGPPVAIELGAPAHGYYDWSPNSEREIARGWISRADSIEEAAALAGIADPARAAQEVKEYNEACATGRDRFGRPAASLVPLDSPPFYCMPLYPGGSNTCGGPRRDEHARIVDVFGEAIPGLYGAGELGEPVGLMYPSNGANISDCMCFGQIAAEHALGVRPRAGDDSRARVAQPS
jgi:succinate dehydrogenase/fumarate reductase flavoprotein subunit